MIKTDIERKQVEVAKDIIEELKAVNTLEYLNKNWLTPLGASHTEQKNLRLQEAIMLLNAALNK